MNDPETTRLVAHVLLDVAAVRSDQQVSHDQADGMMAVAIDRLGDIEAIRLTRNDVTGKLSLDISRLSTASLVLINGLLDGWAASSGQDRDELIADMRRIVDLHVT